MAASIQLDITLTKGALVLSGILSNSRSYGAETIKIVYADDDGNGDPKEETIRYNKDNSWQGDNHIRRFDQQSAECWNQVLD